MTSNDIRAGHILSAIAVLFVISILLAAATNNMAFEFFKNYQASLGWLIALAVSFIAYEGATATARENRRKDELDRTQLKAEHYIKILSELEAMMSFRATLLQSVIDLNEIGTLKKPESTTSFVRKYADFPNITAAFGDIGVFDQGLRLRIYKAYGAMVSLLEACKAGGTIEKIDEKEKMNAKKHISNVVFLFEKQIVEMIDALLSRLPEIGLNAEDFHWVKADIVTKEFDKLTTILISQSKQTKEE